MPQDAYHCAWLENENLGDEAMWRAYVHLYGEKGPHVLAGGTLINRGDGVLDEYARACKNLGRPIPTFGSGVSDPAFWKSRFQRTGWVDRRSEWAAILSRLAVVGVRGPRSKKLLEQAGLSNVRVVGDPAIIFLEEADPHRPRTGRIAISIGGAAEMQGSEQDLLETLGHLAADLEKRYEIHIFPAWSENAPLCQNLAMTCNRAVVHALHLDPAYVRDGLGGCDVAITVKLHMAVLAACANTPFVALEYRPKVRDFTRSLGWERYSFRPVKLDTQALVEQIETILARLRDHRQELEAAAKALKNNFLEYAETLA